MLTIPTDYKKLFKDRTIFIYGAGRSGTSVLERLLGSATNVLSVFEPAVLMYGTYDKSLLGILFESEILPLAQGRYNMNPNDWTYYDNYISDKELQFRWSKNNRRQDAINWIEENDIKFVIKFPELAPKIPALRHIIPSAKFIHIVRNGLDVIQSSAKRGWYTADHCNNRIIDYMIYDAKCNIPVCVDDESKLAWREYDPLTRAACVWYSLVGFWSGDLKIKYEDFCSSPATALSDIQIYLDFMLKYTSITQKHLGLIRKHKGTQRTISINDIHRNEQINFKHVMKINGYEIN